MTLPLPFRPAAALASLVVVAFGSRVEAVAEGSHGKRLLVLPVGLYPPRQDPCPTCEHRTRPECRTITGCPTAEAWAHAAAVYGDENNNNGRDRAGEE